MIRVHGELWTAASKGDIPVGEKVRILRVNGLKLEVEAVEPGTAIGM